MLLLFFCKYLKKIHHHRHLHLSAVLQVNLAQRFPSGFLPPLSERERFGRVKKHFLWRPLELTDNGSPYMPRDRCLICPVIVAKRLDGSRYATWYGDRPLSRRHCFRWRPSSSHGKGRSSPLHFLAHVCCSQTLAHLSNC